MVGKFKIWEVLLFVAVLLLAALVYEIHNDGGRYSTLDQKGRRVLDTRTGTIWSWVYQEDENDGKWEVTYPAIPKGF